MHHLHFTHPAGHPPADGNGSRQPVPQNPYLFQTPNLLHQVNFQNPTAPLFPPQNYNPPFNLYGPPQQNVFPLINPCTARQELLRRIDLSAKKVHKKAVDSGEYTSLLKVSQLTLMDLGVYSWGSLGFGINDIPFLNDLMIKEGKVDTFIHCFVAARKITTLHDLDVAICADEGVSQFEILGMGPLLRHPLIVHYFSISPSTIDFCKIKTEEIYMSLSKLMSKRQPPPSLNSFMDHLMEEYTVSNKENLGLKIQSFGSLIVNIRKAIKLERCAIFSSSEFSEHNYTDNERDLKKQQPPFKAEKEALDRRYDSLLNQVNVFKVTNLCNTHIRFDSSDNEVDETDASSHSQSPPQSKDSFQRVGNCPYPSNAEEMVRLGLKGEKRSTSERKRKRDNLSTDSTPRMLDEFAKGVKARKYDIVFPSDLEDSFKQTDSELRDFLSKWRDSCRDQTAVEFLNMVLNCSEKALENKKRKRLLSMLEIFSSSAGIGLLNAAMNYVKSGMLEKYDTNKTNAHNVDIDIASPASVTIADIVQKVSAYFISSYNVANDSAQHLEKTLTMMKTFRDCETWLTTQFSVQEFSFLGHGDFFGFIEKNISLLPHELHSFLMGKGYNKPQLMASMLPRQLNSFLSHTMSNLSDKEKITSHHFSTFLDKQFPTISFQILGNDIANISIDNVKNKEDGQHSCSVLFSTILLGNKLGHSEGRLSKVAMESEVVQCDIFHRHSSEDAVKCLMKCPMLFDLHSWSHWDLVYGPSLGPLLEWLLSVVRCKDLLCIATRDGKFIRIDHNATAEEFLDAALQGSSYEAAIKLLSLIPLYGGTQNVPVSLLKHFTKRAIEVVIRNSKECMDVTISNESFKPKSSFDGQGIELQNMHHSEFSAASCFILDCLSHIPSEFRSFAAEILVPGLQSFNKDAYSVLLHECKQTSQRLMLHDIGLSLGVVQWLDDFNAFKSLPYSDFVMVSSQNIIKTFEFTFPESSLALKCERDIVDRFCNIETTTSSQGYAYPLFEHPHKLKHQKDDVLTPKRLEDPEKVLLKLDDRFGSDIFDASLVIESIRRDEFGLKPNLDFTEDSLLKKQHARLGRALHCLSQELYSQDSHLLLELIQNADDNIYPENVDPSLAFILQDNSIVILNNEHGFSAQNIKALCDIGNSTKKGGVGYIGHKGIGFKSVFRVTDAPEIHSNGFHVKFDISEGQIGFILPTVVSPYDISIHSGQLSRTDGQTNTASWKTCIVLPFKSKLKEEIGRNSIISLFSDLHPSLLLFLHRLKCIQFRNILNDTFILMRKETQEDGIIKVYHGNEVMSWLVVKQKLQATFIRPDVQTTEIALAFTLEECDNGEYRPYLSQQPVFAFLPLRQYGFKCILQGDFDLPSSREEVDGNSTWNQWLLLEFPKLFVSAEMSFCNLQCFKEYPGKAVSAFMKFVPLMGEVYGFFSHIPNAILSRLRISNCLLLEGHMEWVPPCRVLRGWDDQARLLITDSILDQYLGLGYLKKDIILSDSLAKALGIKNYGPIILMNIMSSICNSDGAIECLGFNWLSSWLVAFNILLTVQSTGYFPNEDSEFDIINNLKKIPFVPLSDGSYGSVAEGSIWLPFDSFSVRFESKHGPEAFPHLYRRLRTVDVRLFSAEMSYIHSQVEKSTNNLIMFLNRIGVQQLSAHEIIKNHIIPGLTSDFHKSEDPNVMVEYLSFVMVHQQFDCSSCCSEKENFILEFRKKPTILTNHGFKCPVIDPIHFSKEFQNPVSTDRFIDNMDSEWHEVDDIYLKHPCSQMLTSVVMKWREFFMVMGVTDFVQVVQVKNSTSDLSNFSSIIRCNNEQSCSVSILSDWESPELASLLTKFSLGNDKDKCKYMLEVLDSMWDDYYGTRITAHTTLGNDNDKRLSDSSFMKIILHTKWVASSIDKELHLPNELFLDCDSVRSILGASAPYAIPQVTSKKFSEDIGFKAHVTINDALAVLLFWRMSASPFKASISQMCKFYDFIWDKLASMECGIRDQLKSSYSIFIPFIGKLRQKDTVPGLFLQPNDVYWHDPVDLIGQIERIFAQNACDKFDIPCRELGNVYPSSLHNFFVNECGVNDAPSFGNYVKILLKLSNHALPHQAASNVFHVLLKWADDLKAGIMKDEEVLNLKKSLSELQNKVFPTTQDNWVSLHPTFGLVCWSDDEELRIQFENSRNIHLLNFGILNNEDRSMLSGKLASLLQKIGIRSLSEAVCREAVFYGTGDNHEKVLLVNWVLSYAQRYMYNLSVEDYILQKEVTLEKLRQLQVCVVEKLYYKHSLKGQTSDSKKKFKCHSLLQGNILYAAYSSDTHPIYLELSRVFFDGSTNLHLANFLHMITTMAESGSNEDQIEFFIVNSQKICKLPPEETLWSLRSKHESAVTPNPSMIPMEGNSTKVHKKTETGSEWPPVARKSASVVDTDLTSKFKILPNVASHCGSNMEKSIDVNVDEDWVVEDNDRAEKAIGVETIDGSNISSSSASYFGDNLSVNTSNEEECYRTGRLGEAAAFAYFGEKLKNLVTWVNKDVETGLPYDLIIDNNKDFEYIEVKTTRSKNKNWFEISLKELEFAFEKGDGFSIARVVLNGPNKAKITVFRNPLKLFRNKVLNLAVLMK